MDQTTALCILKSGYNVYLTGSAGTGKTYLLNQYIEYLRLREVPVAVTASTGIAATHIGGQTIHSWSGVGIRESITRADLDKISKNKQTVTRLVNTQVLIIDEISMLSGKVLSAISDILKHFRKNNEAFGGVQLILSGDFFQLPPVSRERLTNKEKFAFMAPVWVEAKLRVCYLTTQYRQSEDTLSSILSEIRNKSVSEYSVRLLKEKLQHEQEINGALKLFTHNADVDTMNNRKLAENPNPVHEFEAETRGKPKLVESLKQSVLASACLKLKRDARVMFVRNNSEKGYFNGTIGTVVGFEEEEGWPEVRLKNGLIITATPEEWTITDEKDAILAAYRQVPLRLAWAITVHKSQGMTLDAAEIDLSRTFEAGQGYVALSRLKNWEGLVLGGINQASLEVDALAHKADLRFQEISVENERWIGTFQSEQLESAYKEFVIKCGGTLDAEVIKRNKHRERRFYKKEKKESTYARTLKLVEAKKSFEEIAFERELAPGTIISHLQYLRKNNPDVDLEIYRPDHKIIEKVSKTIAGLKNQGSEELLDKNGDVKLSFIYKAMNGKLDYETIRLARLFVS